MSSSEKLAVNVGSNQITNPSTAETGELAVSDCAEVIREVLIMLLPALTEANKMPTINNTTETSKSENPNLKLFFII